MKDEILDFANEYMEQSSVGNKNKLAKATIKHIDRQKGFVVVDAGLKSEGIIPLEEFFLVEEKQNIKEGDQINIFIVDREREGKIVASREKAIKEETLMHLRKCHEENKICSGIIFGKVKGGLSVDINGVIAFLPGSQIDFEAVKDVSGLMGKATEFKVLKIQTKGFGQTVIVSRKAVLEDETKTDRQSFMENIKEGDIVEGVVKNITDYGAFVRLHYGVDGLLYLTDISWNKVTHPSEVLELNQRTKVKVLKIDPNGRISLGMKQLMENPWDTIKEKYTVGANVKGRVSEILKYEVVLEVEKGVEIIINENDLSWNRAESVAKFEKIQLEDIIEAKIVNLEIDHHKIFASVKHLTENPAEKFIKDKQEGLQMNVKITSIMDYGVFVEVEKGIEGKISISDLTWDKTHNNFLSTLSVGQEINVVYIGRSQNKDLKFGIKQLTKSPFETHLSTVKTGDTVTVEVTNNEDRKGIEVKLFNEIKTFIKSEELAKDIQDQKTNKFIPGTRIDAKVIFIDIKNKKITLSIKALEEEQYKNTLKKYGSSQSGASLASVLGKIEE